MNKPETRQQAEFFQGMLRHVTTEYIELSYVLVFALNWMQAQGYRFVWSPEFDREHILAIVDKHGEILYIDGTAYCKPDEAIVMEAFAARTLMHKYDLRNQTEQEEW